MLYRFSIVFLIGLCLVACSSGSMQEESVPVIRFKPDEEGVQKVFGTLDLFVSLLETEIKYPILQGGILPFWTPSYIKFTSIFSLYKDAKPMYAKSLSEFAGILLLSDFIQTHILF